MTICPFARLLKMFLTLLNFALFNVNTENKGEKKGALKYFSV